MLILPPMITPVIWGQCAMIPTALTSSWVVDDQKGHSSATNLPTIEVTTHLVIICIFLRLLFKSDILL